MFTRSFGVRNGGAGVLDFWVETESDNIINITPASSTAPDSVTLLFYLQSLPDPDLKVPLMIHETVQVFSNEAINSPVEVGCRLRFPFVPAELEVSTSTLEFDVYECYQGYGQKLPSAEFTVSNVGGDEPMMVDIGYESELFDGAGRLYCYQFPAGPAAGNLLRHHLGYLPMGYQQTTIYGSNV